MHFSEKSLLGISRLSNEPTAINILQYSTLAKCKVNTYEHKGTGFMNKEPARAGVF